MRKKYNRKKKVAKIENLTKRILQTLKAAPEQSFNYKQIASKFGVDDPSSRNQIIKKLSQLAAQQQIKETDRGKFQLVPNTNTHTGIIDINSKGSGYVVVEDLENDIYIPNNSLNRALHGDEVEVYVYRRKRNGKSEGEVNRIITRKQTTFVGIVELQKNYAFVNVQGGKMYTDIFVPKNKTQDAQTGDKVLVEMVDWPEKADSPFGKITEVLGKAGEHNTEIHAILAQYGLPHEFNKEVEDFADQIDTSITQEEIKKRRDMRKTLTFTIDPKDAKDFDDALSFEKLENGNYEIGIHIADVSHYVKPGTVFWTMKRMIEQLRYIWLTA